MNNEHLPDRNAASEGVTRDQRAAYDDMRRRCPVAHSESMGWTLFRHDDVMRVLLDHETFSNAVSRHLSVPNGMDPPEHTEYRRIIEPFFSPERMRAFEPVCRDAARKRVADLPSRREVEFMSEVAARFAAGVQCAFLGWPEELHDTLVSWMRRNQEATLAQDRLALSAIAREFEAIIDDLLETRRRAGATPDTDLTASLMHEKVWGRPLTNEEVASILRNWTAGEIGTISAACGILAHFLATRPDVQQKLRAEPDLLPPAIEEILRIHGPLVSNRRVTKKPVEIGGQQIAAGERVTLNWISVNRDERVFEHPDEFRLDRDQSRNLLYGAGIHACPGAPLARLELRVFMEELLAHTRHIAIAPDKQPQLAVYPASGYATLPLAVQ
ncbi:MAG TPA: cytochrome P450 [Verrucomicrobia bacterium]|nr:cytochrome P450 [Verrucomicrobiota bacterium]HOB31890.1 cytochrome P450 [Verrucomicrobiota bacterium]HOP97474.1 cytochrome P450 [Verrucomicrobiota bacterium]